MPISYKILHIKKGERNTTDQKELAEKGRQLYLQYLQIVRNLKNCP